MEFAFWSATHKRQSGQVERFPPFRLFSPIHRQTHTPHPMASKKPNLRYPTARELAKLIKRGRSAFFRILDHMRLDHHLPIDIVSERGGYGYTEEVVNFPGIQFCQAELIALFAAQP
jgi:hypothetical protein